MAKRKIKIKKGSKINELYTNSPEYRQLYNSGTLASIDEEGVPTFYKDESIWNDYLEEQRKNKVANAVRQGTGKFVKEVSKLIPGNPNESDSLIENILEITPTPLGRLLSIDDALLAGYDLTTKNESGVTRNLIDIMGVTPYLKLGNNAINPNEFRNIASFYKQFKKRSNPILESLPYFASQIPNVVNYGIPAEGFLNDILEDNNIPALKSDKKALGGKITNDMKKKNKKLPIDNELPKAALGAMLSGLPELLGTGAGAMTGATAGMASGAANGLAGATGAGGGLGSLGSGAGGGLQSLGSKAAGSLQGNMNKDTLGSLGKGMDILSPLANATMQAVTNMIKSFEPEEERRPVLKNIGATYANGGEIKIKPSKRGTFTKAAKQRGMGVQQFASKVLANKDSYSPAMVKKANFARNAAKWKKAMGGLVEPEIFEMGGFTGNYMDMFDYMALGGMMGGGDPTLPPLKATSQDSAFAYNTGMDLGKYYTDRGYKKKDETKLPYTESNIFKTELDKIYNNFLNIPQTTYPTSSGKVVKGKLDPAQYRKPADPTKPYTVEQRDIASNIVDTRAPFGYYDTRIVPQSITSYENVNPNDPLYGDIATVPTYDISTKPYVMRTPEEQAEVERKYGKPVINVRDKVTPVVDIRPDVKKYFKTYDDLDLKQQHENIYREFLRSGKLTGQQASELSAEQLLEMAKQWKAQNTKAYGGMIDPLMAFGGMIDPTMAMQQMMYGSYEQGGQVPQNIPVEVEGEEMYEMPNGETGEFSGPKHENGGIPIALPEGTKIYSDRLKVNGKTMAQRKDKREANISKLEKLLTKNPNDRFIKEALKRQQETAALEEQQDMATQEQANQQQQMQEMAMEEMLMGAAQQDIQEGMMAMGGMIKRADGSYSQRGLWDNIRANRGSGKKPTKEMLKQEKKIRAAEKAYGGMIKYAPGGTIPPYGLMTNQFGIDPTVQAPIYNTREMNLDNYENYLNTLGGGLYQEKPFELRTTDLPVGYSSIENLPSATVTNTPSPLYQTLRGASSKFNPTISDFNELDIVSPEDVESARTMPSLSNEILPSYTYNENDFSQSKGGKSDFFSNIADMFSRDKTKKDKVEKDKTKSKPTMSKDELRYTEGDRTGMTGTAVGMYGPTLMTLLNRLETPPNQNFFNTYGQDALRTQMEAEGIAGQSKDEAYRKNLMRANALRKQLANSARGVGDMRTGQLTAALAEQEGARDILGSYLQSMAGLKGQRANLQAQIDQTRMGAEQQRDLADRQDMDQFYENLAKNLTGISEGMQKMGRDKNIAKRNKDILSLSKYYSSYGIYADYDDKGNLVLKDQSTGKVKSDKEIEKLKEEIEKLKKEKGEG